MLFSFVGRFPDHRTKRIIGDWHEAMFAASRIDESAPAPSCRLATLTNRPYSTCLVANMASMRTTVALAAFSSRPWGR